MATVFIIGDSTVKASADPFYGWGWALHEHVADGVVVENHGRSGRSSRSFRDEGLFEPVRAAMRPQDLLLIQFGHNDEKDDPARHTDPQGDFPQILGEYCDAALAAGALPVLVTPVCRRYFLEEGSLMYTHGEYPAAVRRLARERDLPLCDLEMASRRLFIALGADGTAELFMRLAPGEHPGYPEGHDDRTHFCAYGARRVAALVADMLRNDGRCRAFVRGADKETV